MRHLLTAGALCAVIAAQASAGPMHVRVSGQAMTTGAIALPREARYADAALAAAPTDDAYILAAALQRKSLITRQSESRAGIVYDLSEIARRADEHGNGGVAETAVRMMHWIRDMPITGRRVALLDPRVVEITPADNLPIEDGDTIHYPLRPATVRVVGAVEIACDVAFEPGKDASKYLADCRESASADRDTFYVVQPDGRTFPLARALWNRSDAMTPAPGAILYVPIKAAISRKVDPVLDQEIASFLGTQVLP